MVDKLITARPVTIAQHLMRSKLALVACYLSKLCASQIEAAGVASLGRGRHAGPGSYLAAARRGIFQESGHAVSGAHLTV